MLIVREFKITYRLKNPNSVSEQWIYYRVREQSVCIIMLIVREFKITYRLKNPNSSSMDVRRAVYMVREQSVCNNAHSDVVYNILLLLS